MDKTSCKLTVFFENPFWVGIIECNEDGKLIVTKITFYKEPKDYEIKNFILKKYNQLNFSPAVENVVILMPVEILFQLLVIGLVF